MLRQTRLLWDHGRWNAAGRGKLFINVLRIDGLRELAFEQCTERGALYVAEPAVGLQVADCMGN